MISLVDIAWTAGFLEGEGWFGSNNTSVVICASQVNPEPVIKLKELFRGSVMGPYLPPNCTNSKKQPYYKWTLCSSNAAALMMTIFPLLSAVRQRKVKIVLAKWRQTKGAPGLRTFCPSGHPYNKKNTAFVKRHDRATLMRVCKICSAVAQKKYDTKRRGVLLGLAG